MPSEEEQLIAKRLLDQMEGRATQREYPHGRLGADDDGALAVAIAADRKTGNVIITFGKPVSWVGMPAPEAIALANRIIEAARKASVPIVGKEVPL
jgi:acetyl-CoA carboxylase alpha subunit